MQGVVRWAGSVAYTASVHPGGPDTIGTSAPTDKGDRNDPHPLRHRTHLRHPLRHPRRTPLVGRLHHRGARHLHLPPLDRRLRRLPRVAAPHPLGPQARQPTRLPPPLTPGSPDTITGAGGSAYLLAPHRTTHHRQGPRTQENRTPHPRARAPLGL
nr:MAG TPA: hypothetical protein [Caudoviricetes sp.]